MLNKPVYTVFGGINGAGKSTLYKTIKNFNDNFGIRINPDEIAKELGDFNNPIIQAKAGKIAIEKIRACINKKTSFNQETTLTGKSVLRNMAKLKKEGYTINLYYIGLSSKELAHDRVQLRVNKGGHNIPKDIIYKRYDESINNLYQAMKLADNIEVFDNSGNTRRTLLIIENNCLIFKSKDIPMWFEGTLKEYLAEHYNEKNITEKSIELNTNKNTFASKLLDNDPEAKKLYMLNKNKDSNLSISISKDKDINR